MRQRILASVGWTLFGLAAFVLCCRVVVAYGQEWGFVIVTLCSGAAWAGHTDRSRWFVGLFRRALGKCDISQEKFAIDYGTSKSQVAEAFAGTEQFSMSRAASADDAVWEEFAADIIRAGQKYVVLERGLVADALLANISLHEALREQSEPARPQLAFSSPERKCAS